MLTEPNPAGGTFTTNYTYTPANQLTVVSMTRGNVTETRTFAYNGSDMRARLTRRTALSLTSTTIPSPGGMTSFTTPHGFLRERYRFQFYRETNSRQSPSRLLPPHRLRQPRPIPLPQLLA